MRGAATVLALALAAAGAATGAAEEPPIHRILVYRVKGVELLPLRGPLELEAGQAVELAAEARDSLGLAVELRPQWIRLPELAGSLETDPYSGVATFRAGRHPTARGETYRVQVYDPRRPAVRGTAEIRVVLPPNGDPVRVALPARLEAFVVQDGKRCPIGPGQAIFARPDQACEILVLGVFAGGEARPVPLEWSLDQPRAAALVRLAAHRVRLVAGYDESRPRAPYRVTFRHPDEPTLQVVVPLVVQR